MQISKPLTVYPFLARSVRGVAGEIGFLISQHIAQALRLASKVNAKHGVTISWRKQGGVSRASGPKHAHACEKDKIAGTKFLFICGTSIIFTGLRWYMATAVASWIALAERPRPK